MENSEAEKKKTVFDKIKGINKKKAAIISGGAIVVLAAAAYFTGVSYYGTHYFKGTQIGSFDCSNMTVEEAKSMMKDDIDNYGFTFYEKNDNTETITGEEIHLTHSPIEGLEDIKAEQNPFAWPFNLTRKSIPLNIEVSYDEDALYNRITQMSFMADTRENIKDCAGNIHYEDGAYVIDDDGTKDIVSLNELYKKVKPKISGLYKGMSLEKENCYEGLAEEDTIKGVLAMLNKYAGTKVTYTGGENNTTLDGSTINEWITVTDDYLIRIDPAKTQAYVDELAKSYNTVGKERSFRTTGGSDIKVSGGNYGWAVDNKKEAEVLLDIIRGGETVEREPLYKQSAASHAGSDIADTYVEVSIGAQHMWYYKDGNLIVSSDIVTGNPSNGHATPTGVYRVNYKAKNVVLKGRDYASPVSFWMPFNGGVGLHDASWRGAFGGRIYQGGGSHGCVNLPYSAAKTLYSNISAGEPVVVY